MQPDPGRASEPDVTKRRLGEPSAAKGRLGDSGADDRRPRDSRDESEAPGSRSSQPGGDAGATRDKESRSLVGHLLVATPALRDPNFDRTVVLLVAHEQRGALGVVLNRATEISVGDVLAGWGALATAPSVVFEGGPVQPDAAICLGRSRTNRGQTRNFSRVEGNIGTVDLTADPDDLRGEIVEARIFAGYAGWAPGQLEAEIATGSWMTFRALPSDAFTQRPDDLWAMVLRRQGGIYAAVAQFPTDPTLN